MVNPRPKSKAQLLEEIQALQERLAQLGDAQGEPDSTSQDHISAGEEVYRDLYEEAPVAYFSISLDGKIQKVNRRAAELLGYPQDQLAGQSIIKFYAETPMGQERGREIFRRFEAGEDIHNEELELARADGRSLWISLTVKPILNAQNKVVASRSIAVDITEQKQAMEALRISEERLRILFETSPDGILIDQDGSLLFANSAYQQMFGIKDLSRCLGKPYAPIIAPRDRERVLAISAARETGEVVPTTYEFIGRRADGVEFPVEVTAAPLVLYEQPATMAILRDITERKQAEEALRASEERFRNLVETSQGLIWSCDAKGRFTYLNPAWEKLLGYELSEMLGHTFSEFKPPEIAKRDLQTFKRILKGKPSFGYETVHISKSGEHKNLVFNARVVKDSNGKTLGTQGTAHDITERNQAEAALAAERERLAITLRSIADGVMATDMAGRVVLLNKAAEELTGWDQSDALGQPLAHVLTLVNNITDKKIMLPTAELILGDLASVPLRPALLLSPSSDRIPVTLSMSRLTDKQEQVIGLVVVIRDVSEKEKLESEMRKAQKLESLGLLAGGLAHDFNNFLMSIMLNVSSARLHAREQPEILDLLREAERSVHRAKGITQQLLTFTRGGQPVQANMYLTPLLKETVKFSLRGTIVQPRFDLRKDLWSVSIDPDQINQVLNNLVINAVQAMPKGGILTVSTENVTVDDLHPRGPLGQGNYVEVTIADEGVGIPADILDRIYDPYFTTKDQGTGLGLFSVYSIINKHGGWIIMDSTKDAGTTARFYLPTASKPDAPVISATEMVVPGTSKILLMDDEEAIRRLLGRLLNEIGFTVETAPDGTAAVEQFQAAHSGAEPFQAVIFDLMVPGDMDGVEAFKRIRQIDKDIKGIIMSGHGSVAAMRKHGDHGFQGKLAKPFTTTELTKVLEQVIRG